MAEKLVRDLIPALARSRGQEPKVRQADGPVEWAELLWSKLFEEVTEAFAADDRDDLLRELADVFEVIVAIADLSGWTDIDLLRERRRKAVSRGRFTQGYVMEVEG